ncbi:MAG: aminotransferase [Lachnospiraceae bacterium]|nr:aminotransferase [Lachnospiraceae bacterium]
MKSYQEMSKEELLACKAELEAAYKEIQDRDLSLNMARGKPSSAQLDTGVGLLDALTSKDNLFSEEGTDCRNYGVLDGIVEAKRLMAAIMDVKDPENVIIYGNGSLSIMYDTVSRSYTHGVAGCTPWCKLDQVKWLCPVPGYDRHFAITEHFGIEMINIPMLPTGPDMDMVEDLVSKDPSIKGIWCVPKYSNPQGITYSDETVKRFARLKPAAKDFRIYWDNAYVIHDLYEDDKDSLLDIIGECEKAGNPDLVFEFASLSKVSLAGAGIAALACSKANREETLRTMTIQTIGYDKLNMLRHVRYFKNLDGVKARMREHASSMRPKFEALLHLFDTELSGRGAGSWIAPKGGYFITYEAPEGCAKAIVQLCKEAGIVLTKAGAPFPYGKDPRDSVIRVAPSFPSAEELAVAGEVFVVCVKLATVKKLLGEAV